MKSSLRVFISSTAEDLRPFRAAAYDVVQDLEWHPVGMEHKGTDPRPTVKACLAWVAECDVVLFIQAWRRGWVPKPEEDGDGETSITGLELGEAKRLGKPVLALLADGDWPRRLCELDPGAIAWVEKFRGDVNRSRVSFRHEEPPHISFRAAVKTELVRHWERTLSGANPAAADAASKAAAAQIGLRLAGPLPLPPEPYPLLAPCAHPATFAGREREIDELLALLGQERLIVTLHAPSGAGKSSLLLAGLRPKLTAAGIPVSFERRPAEPGLARRLVADLLDLPEGTSVSDQAPEEFARWLLRAREKSSGKPPVLVLDQFEDTLRDPDTRAAALARLGPLLAATAQRLPGLNDPVCRWVLAYRHDFHGEVREWLADVLAEARRAEREGLDALPHDLSGEDRAKDWPLPVLGKSKGRDASKAARRSFLGAIQRPLSVEEPAGTRKYALDFAAGAAERLAAAFAAKRLRQPEAPLVPELQVVLAYLIANATEGPAGRKSIEVPEDEAQLEAMIGSALEDHLRRALTGAFPAGRDAESARRGRARALLALRELADAHGRRGEGLAEEALLRILGEDGQAVLEKLASPGVRLILREERDGAFVWVLSHDRMAEVVTRLVEDQSERKGLDVDSELVALRRFVVQRADLFFGSRDETALDLKESEYRRIEESAGSLVSDGNRAKWWAACKERRAARQRERVRQRATWAVGAVVGLAVMVFGWLISDKGLQQERVRSSSEPRLVLAAAARLQSIHHENPWDDLLERDGGDEALRSVLVEGPWDTTGRARVESTILLDLLEGVTDSVLVSRPNFGAIVAVVDEIALRNRNQNGNGSLAKVVARARVLREKIRQRFARLNGIAVPSDSLNLRNKWMRLRAGTFTMGSMEYEAESPPHPVQVDSFYIQQHEVTNREYLRFDPGKGYAPGDSLLPVVGVSWYEAMAYAAWIGASLPTEAQWEYAARGPEGREYPWEEPGGPTPERVAYRRGFLDRPDLVMSHPTGATPDTVHDLAGNVWEWCRDLYGKYGAGEQTNPIGPAHGTSGWSGTPSRVLRGGAFRSGPEYLRGAARSHHLPEHQSDYVGFRCVRGGS